MPLLYMSSRSSVDRAPAWCLGGYGFDSRRGLRFFSTLVKRYTVIYPKWNSHITRTGIPVASFRGFGISYGVQINGGRFTSQKNEYVQPPPQSRILVNLGGEESF